MRGALPTGHEADEREFEGLDFRLWRSEQAAKLPQCPPYSHDEAITPISKFSEHTWLFPACWIPVNARQRHRLEFLGVCKLPRSKVALRPSQDGELISQLKELLVAVMFRRQALPGDIAKKRLGRPTGFYSALQKFRRLFNVVALLGRQSIGELTQDEVPALLELMGEAQAREVAWLLRDVAALSRCGLIRNGLLEDLEIAPGHRPVTDTTKPRGWQPIGDEAVSDIIRSSIRYLELAPELLRVLASCREGPPDRRDVVDWARSELPCGPQLSQRTNATALASVLTGVLQVACGNLILFHVGMRISELMSMKLGCISMRDNQQTLDLHLMKLELVTAKNSRTLPGDPRFLAVHPRLGQVHDILVSLAAISAPQSKFLFALFDGLPAKTNGWNYRLLSFCLLHASPVKVSSHMWRKTLASLIGRLLTGSALLLKEMLGHESLDMISHYLMASPFIRNELRELMLDNYRKSGRMLLESAAASGGPGLGGIAGKELSARFRRMVDDTDLSGSKFDRILEEWTEEMLTQGIMPVAVMPGVFCMKPLSVRGACSTSSGDRMADPARCTARCSHQVQQAHRHALVRWTVGEMCSKWREWSPMIQTFWAGQCRDQLIAWPELVSELRPQLKVWPELARIVGPGSPGA